MKNKKKKPRKNSNYKTASTLEKKRFAEVAKCFAEYEYLQKQPAYTVLLDMESHSEAVGQFIHHVFVQLQQCLGTLVPDYLSFRENVGEFLWNENQTTALPYKSFFNGALQGTPANGHALYMIAALYHGAMKRFTQDLENEPDEQKRQALAQKYRDLWTRQKLLIHMFEDADRLLAGLEAMTSEMNLTEDGLLEFGDEIPSPQNLMGRLSYALHHNLKDAADRLVGMLQMVRDKLDPGEYAYFSAMVYMKESNPASLDKACKELKKIPTTAVEYATSRGMLAEIWARKGDPGAFLEAFDYTEHINSLAMCGYVQQLILNTALPSVNNAILVNLKPTETTQQLGAVIHKFLDYYGRDLNISWEAPEYFCYLNNVLEAAQRYYHFYLEIPNVVTDHPKDAIVPGSVSNAHMLLSITASPCMEALNQLLKNNTKTHRLQFVTQYFNFPKKGSITASSPRLDLMVRAARAFLENEEFVDYFLSNLHVLEQVFERKLLQQWLTEAYFTSLSCEHPQQTKLREMLDNLCLNQDASFEEDATYRSVLGMLTAPSKLLYASAESSYRAARDSDYGWKDAGMLSLGFFRLVEVELRQRLLVDVFGKKDPDVYQWQHAVDERCMQESENSQYGEFVVGKEKFALSRTLLALRQPEKLSMEQMEYCFLLLSEQAEIAPEWDIYRESLRRKFYRVLSTEGIQASKDGRIAQAICLQKRQYFRNPPAHARYLSIEKAEECRDYVNDTIRTLCGTWLA